MKAFITSLLLFFSISLFAQPQKGDLYFGFSNLNINSLQFLHDSGSIGFSSTVFSLSPTFGKFITNNTLLGGGFSFSRNLSSLSVSSFQRNRFGINLFGAQYFGKGNLKGLSQVAFNSNLIKNGLSGGNNGVTGDLGLGGAYFVNEFTSVQLLYNINLFTAIEGFGTEYFTTNIAPNLNLTLRTFLLRNREGVENLSALNSIKKGTKVLGLAASLRDLDESYSHSYNGKFNYFLADNLYMDIGLSYFLSRNNQLSSESSSFNVVLGAGYYLRISERFYAKLATGMIGENRYFDFTDDRVENVSTDLNAIRWNTQVGTAFFLGRHKLEPGLGFRWSNVQFEEKGIDSKRDFSPSLFINYEWFLAENFAFTSNGYLQLKDTSYFVIKNGFSGETEVIENAQNNTNINVGFKWYLSTPTE